MRRFVALIISAVAVLAVVPAFAAGEPLAPCQPPAGASTVTHEGTTHEFTPALTPSPLGPDAAPSPEAKPVFDAMDAGATQSFTYQFDISGAPLLPTGLPPTAADLRVRAEWTDPAPQTLSDYDLYVKDADGDLIVESHTFNPQTNLSYEEVTATRLPHCSVITIEFVSASGVPGVDALLKLTASKFR